MSQFPVLLRSTDRQPVRYLIVDDSVFARKNLAKMIESFGGKVAGEAGDGCTAIIACVRIGVCHWLCPVPAVAGLRVKQPEG